MYVTKYITKPIVIEARQLKFPDTYGAIAAWCNGILTESGIQLKTREDVKEAYDEDYIVKNTDSTFSIWRSDIFESTYEKYLI